MIRYFVDCSSAGMWLMFYHDSSEVLYFSSGVHFIGQWNEVVTVARFFENRFLRNTILVQSWNSQDTPAMAYHLFVFCWNVQLDLLITIII